MKNEASKGRVTGMSEEQIKAKWDRLHAERIALIQARVAAGECIDCGVPATDTLCPACNAEHHERARRGRAHDQGRIAGRAV